MLKIAIRPSRRLMLLLCLAHAAAVGACLAADMPVSLKLLMVLLIGLSCGHAVYGAALLRNRNAIVALEISDGGVVTFRTRSGQWRRGTVLNSTFVAPYLTVLNLKVDGRRRAYHAVVMADSVAADEYRRLSVWLRWRKTAADDEKI